MLVRFAAGFFYVALAAIVYCRTYSFEYLFNADALIFEDMYLDFFRQGGTLAQWALPIASYWLDMGLYFLVRLFSPSVYVAMSSYAAAQVCLLALAVWYFLVSLPGKNAHSVWHSGILAALSTLAVCIADGDFLLIARPAYHATALILFFVLSGLFFRFLDGRAASREYAAAFLLTVPSVAADAIFVLWFCIPAAVYVSYLSFRGRLSWRTFRWFHAGLFLAIAAGKAVDAVFKTSVTAHTAVRISGHVFRYIFDAFRMLGELLTDTPFNMFLTAFAVAGMLLFFRRKDSRQILLFFGVVFACTLGGVCISGRPRVRYLMPVYYTLLLLGPAFFMAFAPVRQAARVAAVCILVLSLVRVWPDIATPKDEFYPPLVACVDRVAEKHGVNDAITGYWETRLIETLSKKGVHAAQTNTKYFSNWHNIATSNSFRDKYHMVIVDESVRKTNTYEEEIVTFINGSPDAIEMCVEGPYKILVYNDGARSGTEKDYLLYDGMLSSSKPGRDFLIWEGKERIGSTTLEKVAAVYRMGQLWITAHLAEPPEALMGEQFAFYLGGDKSRYFQKMAIKRFDISGNGVLNSLWKRLLDRKTVVVSQENTYPSSAGGSVLFFKAPDREMKKWVYFAAEHGDHISRLK